VISRAKASDSRIRNADELLVCAALAVRSGEFGVATRAAAAMGKIITRPKQVTDWVTRIERLEQASDTASSSAVDSSGLLVHRQWISKEAPGIHHLEAEPLLLSPGERHGKRKLTALTTTPGGTAHEVSATVEYTLPPAAGERESAAKRRADRHRWREQKQLRALDLSGVGLLSEALLVKPSWIARNTTNLEAGSFSAGEIQVDNEARHTARIVPCARVHAFSALFFACVLQAPAPSAFRWLQGKRTTTTCGMGDMDILQFGERWEAGGAVCGEPTQLTCCEGDTDCDAVLAAWNKQPGSEAVWERVAVWECVEQLMEQLIEDQGGETRDELNNRVGMHCFLASEGFTRAYYGYEIDGDVDERDCEGLCAPEGWCDVCKERLPSSVVRWRCESCEWDCCLACSDRVRARKIKLLYELPPAAGESKADQHARKQRAIKWEESAIRDLDGGAAAERSARKAAADRERRRREQSEAWRGGLASWEDFWDCVSDSELVTGNSDESADDD
jgi:hypothetical protein